MATLFISDLHLSESRPAITALFFDFLEREARAADALYILGDFFEYWIGDEAIEQPQHRPIVRRLRAITDGGTPIFFMHGNRDFLVGEGFARASGCRLLPDPTCIDLYGTRTLLMHGDSLCTDDTEHMAFRKMTRDVKWQRDVLAKPIAEREAMARMYREQSGASMSQKAPDLM